MVEKIIGEVLCWMDGKNMWQIKNALYQVLSRYDISEKSTELERIDKSWEKEFSSFLIHKRVGAVRAHTCLI